MQANPANMIQYHYAKDSVGNLIPIKSVSHENRAEHYYCIGCGEEMSAVLGKKREHHFRHKNEHCSRESYLHKLGKLAYKYWFDNADKFIIQYKADFSCSTFTDCKLSKSFKRNSFCKRDGIYRRIDLKKYYDTCEEEVWHNGFRADLLLSNSQEPKRKPIFIEIAVTHNCEQEKINSGIRIIEVKLNNEYDLKFPLTEEPLPVKTHTFYSYAKPQEPNVRFHNFKRELKSTHSMDKFWVAKDTNGTLRGYHKAEDTNCLSLDTHKDEAIYELCIPTDLVKQKNINLYDLGMRRSANKGIGIKHCAFCINYRLCTITNGNNSYPVSFLRDDQIDKIRLSNICKKYLYNKDPRKPIINLPPECLEWEKE